MLFRNTIFILNLQTIVTISVARYKIYFKSQVNLYVFLRDDMKRTER